MAQAITLRAAGVYTHPNRLGNEVPEGALARAQNCVIDRDGLIEPRRGFKAYSAAFSAGTPVRRQFSYASTRIAHVGSTLYKDNGSGTYSSFSGSYAEPASGFRIREVIAGNSLYFTTSLGLQELDAISGTPRAAGAQPPLTPEATINTTTGFMADNSAVAYRWVFYRPNASGREIVSPPSERAIVRNTTGVTRNILVTVLLGGVGVDHWYRLYRSDQTAASTDEPGDEMQLVAEGPITAAQVVAGFIQFQDIQPDELRGATLYTSQSQEGIENSNDRPPLAYDVCEYRTHLVFANVRGRHRYLTQLLGTGVGALRYALDNVVTTNGSPLVTSVGNASQLRVGMKPKAAAGIPSTARILSIDLGALEITLTQNATASGARDVEFQEIVTIAGVEYFAATAEVTASKEFLLATAGTPSVNIETTARSICKNVNSNASATVYAFFDSSGEDSERGKMRFEERSIGGAAFTFLSIARESFSPTPEASVPGVNSTSDNDLNTGGVMVSKPGQYEAVPIGNSLNRKSGSPTAIKRCISLRDGVYLLSDQIHRMSGTDISNFDIQQLDTTAKLIGPETAVVLADAIYCMSTQGVIRISEAGVEIVSRPIELDLIRASKFTNFADYAFAVARESERAYLLWIQESSSDTKPTIAWRFNTITRGWTGPWRLEATSALCDPVDDKLYLGDKTASKVFQERKAYDRTDFADAELAVTITASLGTLVQLSSTTGVLAGDRLVQGASESIVETVLDATSILVRESLSWSAAGATTYRGYEVVVEWLPATLGNPGVLKRFTEVGLVLRAVSFQRCTLGYASNFLPTMQSIVLYGVNYADEDGVAPWGDVPFGSETDEEQVIRTGIGFKRQRGNWLRVAVRFYEPRGYFALAGLSLNGQGLTTKILGARHA